MKISKSEGGKYVLNLSREYSVYVNETRAIPRVTDGLKDAMRKAMWVMRSRGKIKTSALSGAMQEQQLYNHGDASDSICSLAAPFGNNIPLLRANGNFGTRTEPTAYSAPRYTEVSRPSYSESLFYTDIDIVPLIPNFDGSNVQPSTFLPALPMVMINGMRGMGVGWATSILPRNPEEVALAVMCVLNGKPVPLLKPHYNWCDCIVEFVEYHPNGGAKWWFGGRVTIKDTSTLVVTDLPPEMTLEKFKERLNDMEDRDEINGYEDSSSSKIRVEINLKRGVAKGWTERDAIEFLKIKYTKTENIVVIGWNGDTIINYTYDGVTDPVARLITEWVEWRSKWFVDRYQFLLDKDRKELVLRLLIKACFDKNLPAELPKINDKSDLTARVKAISTTVTSAALPQADATQIEYVVSLPTYRWTLENKLSIVKRIAELESLIADWKTLLSDQDLRIEVFKDETKATKKSIQDALKLVEEIRETKE